MASVSISLPMLCRGDRLPVKGGLVEWCLFYTFKLMASIATHAIDIYLFMDAVI